MGENSRPGVVLYCRQKRAGGAHLVFSVGPLAALHTLCAKLLQVCPALWDPMRQSLPGSSVHGILQERILEWIAIPPPGDFPDPEIVPWSLSLLHQQAGSLPIKPPGKLHSSLLFSPKESCQTLWHPYSHVWSQNILQFCNMEWKILNVKLSTWSRCAKRNLCSNINK